MSTGAFLGTFDPLHGGHIGQLLRAHRALPLSKILILVDIHPSHKPNASSLQHRLKMAELTLDSLDLPFEYSIEAAKNGHLDILASKFTHRIIGVDSVISDISKQRWDFLTAWPMIILSIPGIPQTDLEEAIDSVPEDVRPSLTYLFVDETTAPIMNYDFRNKSFTSERVHSTDLRAGDKISSIPASTQQYIQRHNLFK